MKHCPDCGEDKPRSEFHSDRSRGDGLSGFCKECRRERTRAWNKQNPERKADAAAAWFKANSELVATRARAWREANPERAREIARRAHESYKQRHPVRYALRHRSEVRSRRLGGDALDFACVVVADPCSYCGGEGGTLDHIDPLVFGGPHDPTNFTSACHSCNSQKGAKSLLSFLLTNHS